jgi:hypothetical protein
LNRPWPADQVERWVVDRLFLNARNARTHTDEQVALIANAIKEWGWTNPVLVDESGVIIAGHGRVLAAQLLKLAEVPVMVARGWTEAQRRAYALADNQLALSASWDADLLTAEIDELRGVGFDVDLIGFEAAELDELTGNSATDPDAEPDGSLLALANITIADPRTAVTHGDRWQLGPHSLAVCSVIEDWPLWVPLLTDGALLCVFPGPFVLASERAKDATLVLVQPDTYAAGHIIDRYIDLFGQEQVAKVASA